MINNTLTFENARLLYRNFSGKEGHYNPAGQRNFCVLINDDDAESLLNDGWNIKFLEPKDPSDKKQAFLQVKVSYENFPPRIMMITTGNKTILSEDSIKILDWAEIKKVDLVIRPYNWDVQGKKGTKAYLKSMYITLAEDDLESKYRNVPDAANVPEDADVPWN